MQRDFVNDVVAFECMAGVEWGARTEWIFIRVRRVGMRKTLPIPFSVGMWRFCGAYARPHRWPGISRSGAGHTYTTISLKNFNLHQHSTIVSFPFVRLHANEAALHYRPPHPQNKSPSQSCQSTFRRAPPESHSLYREAAEMDLDSFLQLFFGLVATMLVFLGWLFKHRLYRGKTDPPNPKSSLRSRSNSMQSSSVAATNQFHSFRSRTLQIRRDFSGPLI